MEQTPYQYQQQPLPPSTSGMAIASLVLSILGLIGVLPLIGSIVGVILGYMAKGQIAGSRGRIGGEGVAKGGIVVGWIAIVLWGVITCLLLLFFVVFPIVGLGGLSICSGLEGYY